MEDVLTLRDFINKHSNAAWISFDFTADRWYTCISIEDFILDYGRKSEHILDEYVVLSYESSYPSQSQGSVYFLKLQTKEAYDKEKEQCQPGVYTKGQEEIINRYYKATMDALIGNAVIMDTGSGWDAMEEVTHRLNKLSDKDKNAIRSIVLGYNYKKYVRD